MFFDVAEFWAHQTAATAVLPDWIIPATVLTGDIRVHARVIRPSGHFDTSLTVEGLLELRFDQVYAGGEWQPAGTLTAVEAPSEEYDAAGIRLELAQVAVSVLPSGGWKITGAGQNSRGDTRFFIVEITGGIDPEFQRQELDRFASEYLEAWEAAEGEARMGA